MGEYEKIDAAIRKYEEYRSGRSKISWITDRIAWAYRFKRITEEQMTNLCNRVIDVLNAWGVNAEI